MKRSYPVGNRPNPYSHPRISRCDRPLERSHELNNLHSPIVGWASRPSHNNNKDCKLFNYHSLAMVHAAVYDAANAVSQTHKVYKVPVQPPAGASAEAAAVAAAHRVLANLYPQQTATLDAAKTASLTAIAEGKSKTDGLQLGEFVADKILEWRKDDSANTEVTYTPVNQPGYWQPIPPDLKPASTPHWKNIKPFAMTKGSQFQIANMPSLTSEEYKAEFNKLKELGAKDSKTRTADQSA